MKNTICVSIARIELSLIGAAIIILSFYAIATTEAGGFLPALGIALFSFWLQHILGQFQKILGPLLYERIVSIGKDPNTFFSETNNKRETEKIPKYTDHDQKYIVSRVKFVAFALHGKAGWGRKAFLFSSIFFSLSIAQATPEASTSIFIGFASAVIGLCLSAYAAVEVA